MTEDTTGNTSEPEGEDAPDAAGATPSLVLTPSRGFTDWLKMLGGSLAFTTYQAGKVFFIGTRPDNGRLSIFERSFPRSMGLAVSPDGRTLLMATQAQIFRFDNVLPRGQRQDIYDAVYAPKQTWITGDLDVHDVGFGPGGRPVFVNTLFNCVAAVSDGYSFRPLWRPDFISRLAAEDRCHLNGMAMDGERVTHVTCVSRSDVADGWRDRRAAGGLLIDVESGAVLAEGLSMPHSPRLRDGVVWLLNSGTGELGHVEPGRGFVPRAFCPGYARGLAICGRHAIVGLSLPRENRTFQGLPLDAALGERNAQARCGLLIVDLDSGDTVAWLRIEGVVRELYDVAFLPGVACPSAIGLKGPEILKVISIEDDLD